MKNKKEKKNIIEKNNPVLEATKLNKGGTTAMQITPGIPGVAKISQQQSSPQQAPNEAPKKSIKIMMCIPGSHFTNNFVKSLVATIGWCIRNNIALSVRNAEGSNIYALREEILEPVFDKNTKKMEIFGGENYDYVFWVDSDMQWRPEDLKLLIDADKDIISGACIKTSGEFAASYFFSGEKVILCPKLRDNHFVKEIFEIKNIPAKDIVNMTEPVTVSACGFAFILMKKGVLESFGPPWFMQVTHKTANLGNLGYFGEDFSFCVRAQNAGWKIWWHPKVIIGHKKEMILVP